VTTRWTHRSHFDESRQRRLKLRRLFKSISRKVGRPFSNRSRPNPWGCRWPGSNRRTSIFRHPDTRTGDRPVRYHWLTTTGIRNSGSSFCTGIHKSALNTPSLSTGFSFIYRALREDRGRSVTFFFGSGFPTHGQTGDIDPRGLMASFFPFLAHFWIGN
jgi:hypothetical protein